MQSLLFLLAVSSALAAPEGPGAGHWSVELPEDHGFSTSELNKAWQYMQDNSPIRQCLVVIKDGALVYEAYGNPRYKETAHEGFSQTKTLGSLIIGALQTEGKLHIDDDTREHGVSSPVPYNTTLRHILSQAIAGDAPGEAWRYDAVGSMWIDRLVDVAEAASNEAAGDIWTSRFAEPLGLENFRYNARSFATGSRGTCRDFARIGQLMLNRGEWPGVEGGNIVSGEYIDEMSSPQTRFEPYEEFPNSCYGLLTWLNTGDEAAPLYPGDCLAPDGIGPEFPHGAAPSYFAAGLFGQITMVVPSHNSVVVSMGLSLDQNGVPPVMYEAMCDVFGDPCA